MRRILTLSAILMVFVIGTQAQTYNMGNGTVTTCSGTFYDSGGSGSNYSNNETYTYTICPGIAGGKIKLNFTSFDAEAGCDYLYVYDGTNTSAPLLGMYDNDFPLIGSIQATASNASGCLTFYFDSDWLLTYGGWAASISCIQPCQAVQAVLTSSAPAINASYIDICQGQTVTFNATANYPQNGSSYTQSNATSTFAWDFGDGTTGTGTTVTHTYPTAGGYNVDLVVTDINNCKSNNDIDIRVRVSTTPIFAGTFANPTTICSGQNATLTGVVTPVTYNMPTGAIFAGTTFLPDGSGTEYTTDLCFTDFNPGQTVTSTSDIVGICADLEHSFLGDLEVYIECPNGDTMSLFDGYNGTGGIEFLGEPVDDDASLTPGNPYNYCFSSAGTSTFEDIAAGTPPTYSYTDNDGNSISGHEYIAAGTYNAEGLWTSLVGCPLNGCWTIHVIDHISSDNGYIFQWSINFLPSLYPALWSFTPNIVSSTWSGPGLASTPTNPVTFSSAPVGTNTYTYSVTDNFGCTYDTTVNITVNNGNAPSFTQLGPYCLNATPGALPTTSTNGVTGTWSPATISTASTGNTTYTFTPDAGQCGSNTTMTVNVTSSILPLFTTPGPYCVGDTPGALPATSTNGITGTWSPATISTASAGNTTYTFTPNAGQCASNTTMTVAVNASNTITLTSAAGTNTQSLCINTMLTNITYSTTSATGATFSGLPSGVTGNWAANTITISGTPSVSGTFNYTITLTGGCGTVTTTGSITVTPVNTITLTSGAGSNAQSICINTPITNITYATTGATGATVTGLPTGVTGSWTANVVTITGSPTVSGTFNYTITLNGGCGNITATGSLIVVTANTIVLSSAVGSDAQSLCLNTPLTSITYVTTGATGATFSGFPSGITGNWAANTATISGTPSVSGTFNYTITTTGGCGVASSTGTITVNPVNTIALTSAVGTNAQELCINNTITNITYATTGATGATFSGLPSAVTGNWAANAITISGTAITAGTYNYTVTLTGGCGNITATGSIIINPIPTVAIIPQNPAICLGRSVNLTATGADSYTWTPVTGLTPSTGSVVSAAPTTTTTYTVTGDASGCTNMATVVVTVNTTIPITVFPANSSICPGESTTLAASGAATYIWSPTATLSSSTGSNVTATPAATTVYTVEGTGSEGCTGTATAIVSINPLASIGFTIQPKTGCEPLSADFTFIPGSGILDNSWLWNFGEQNATSTDTITNHVYNSNGIYVVGLTAQTVDGCNVSVYDTVSVYPMPVADFEYHPDILTTENPIVNFIDNSTNADHWEWNFGDPESLQMNTSGASSPTHNYSEAGIFNVLLTASNVYGCVDTATAIITVHDAFAFWIPNSFSPNGDRVNEVFLPLGTGFLPDTYMMRILDRWGKTMFFTKDIERGWDGTDYNTGKDQHLGVYTYHILITDASYHVHEYVGSLTLVR